MSEVGAVEITPSHEADVGGHRVLRALPRRARRTVGSWCFVDHMAPSTTPMAIGPHPHIGLQTVTWLLEGELLHTDSLGSEQLIRPGQLNLMTAGHGIAHAEESVPTYTGGFHGGQLWVAQPDDTRGGAPAFEHHAELPRLDLGDGATGTVLVGDLAGTTSPARRDTDHLGADLDLAAGAVATVPVVAGHEHAVVVLAGAVSVAHSGRPRTEAPVGPGQLIHLDPGIEEIEIRAAEPTRALLLGGTPWPEPPLIVWNYVARTRAEVAAANDAWNAGEPRFGAVRSTLPRIPGPDLAPHA